ncbi:MAG: DMT family transporter [Gammaproteobacteria bacterium]
MKANPLLGVALMTVAMMLLPLGDGIAKYLTGATSYGSGFLAWSRFVVGVATVVPFACLTRAFAGLGWRFAYQQAIRGALVAGAIGMIITALESIPLADAFGAFFIGPALATVLAALVLRERVTRIEWVAVALGFLGVLLVVRPSGDMSVGLLWALAGGSSYGGFLVATRWATNSGPAAAQLAGQLCFGLLILAPFGARDLVTHGIEAPGMLLLMGAISVTSNLLSILALARARAAFLAPVVYVQIISATAYSWLIFDQIVDTIAFLGLMLIIAAGISRIPFGMLFAQKVPHNG